MIMSEVFFTTAPPNEDLEFTYNGGPAGFAFGMVLRQVNVLGKTPGEVIDNSQAQLYRYMADAYAVFSPNLLAYAIDTGVATLAPDRCESCYASSLYLMVDADGKRICRNCSYKEA
jgi:hypothetical protein